MAWVSVDKDGTEVVHEKKPSRGEDKWGYVPTDVFHNDFCDFVILPKGSIKKLIGRELIFDDEPVELA